MWPWSRHMQCPLQKKCYDRAKASEWCESKTSKLSYACKVHHAHEGGRHRGSTPHRLLLLNTEPQVVAPCFFFLFLIDTTNVNVYILYISSRMAMNLPPPTHLEFLQTIRMNLADTTSNRTATEIIHGKGQTDIHCPTHGGHCRLCDFCKLKRTVFFCEPCGNSTICMGACFKAAHT